MNKVELASKIFKEYEIEGAYKKQVVPIVEAVFDAIAETIASGEDVTITGFGRFSAPLKEAHEAVNPLTREVVKVEAHRIPKMKWSDVLRNKLKA